mmetsp:Transcript_56122/g.162561  ORF Transcript_56122/g.162561 Transcript_56122/m.162561 type:complete len:215 (-) Transcript_56122:176-820(-)
MMSRFVFLNFCVSFMQASARCARLMIVWSDTFRNPFSLYQGIAMLFVNTGMRSSGTCKKKSFMSMPPCRASVSRTNTMVLFISTAQRSSCAHQADESTPSVMKKMKVRQFFTPLRNVSINPSSMSTSKSTKILMPGRAWRRNSCIEIIASCAFRCKCDKKTSYSAAPRLLRMSSGVGSVHTSTSLAGGICIRPSSSRVGKPLRASSSSIAWRSA